MMKISFYKAEDLARIVTRYALEYQELCITIANSAGTSRTTNDERMTARMETSQEVYNTLIHSFGKLGIINTGKAHILRIDFITALAPWDEESMMQRVMDIFYIDED